MRWLLGLGFSWLIIVLVGIVGWIANICQVVALAGGPVTGVFVLKCIGILAAPLGAILGLIGLF